MKKSIVIFAILLVATLLGAIAFRNYYSMNNSQTPVQEPIVTQTPTIQPTPQPTLEPKTTASIARVIPKPSILRVVSPINTTYASNTIKLTYSINSKVLWSYYGLDLSKPNSGSSQYTGINELFALNGLVPFKGNITLNVPEGQHRIMIAVQTEESRGSSVPIAYQTIDFIIDTTSSP